jgi:hypothetical protein
MNDRTGTCFGFSNNDNDHHKLKEHLQFAVSLLLLLLIAPMRDDVKDDDDDEFTALVEWELNKRRGRSATYTQPLLGGKHPLSIEEEENIHSFLSEFYSYQIYDNMMNMKHTLQMYSDTVAIHYGLLVPNICSFDEFWSRYYYRCSIVQVKKDLIARQQRTGSYTIDDCSDSTTNLENNIKSDSCSVDTAAMSDQPTGSKSVLPSNSTEKSNENKAPKSITENASPGSNNRTQMFYQENDRDIIEVIPEEEHDDEDDINEFDTVCITDSRDISTTTSVLIPSKNEDVAIGF